MVCGRLTTYTLIGIVVIIKVRIVISESVLFVSSFLYIGTIHVHLPNPILSTVVLWLILTMLPSSPTDCTINSLLPNHLVY